MSIVKNLFQSLLSQDMGKQARQVQIIALIGFVFLLLTVSWLWQYQIELTEPTASGRRVIAKMNVFELLLSKQ